jgi:hypothetical protein
MQPYPQPHHVINPNHSFGISHSIYTTAKQLNQIHNQLAQYGHGHITNKHNYSSVSSSGTGNEHSFKLRRPFEEDRPAYHTHGPHGYSHLQQQQMPQPLPQNTAGMVYQHSHLPAFIQNPYNSHAAAAASVNKTINNPNASSTSTSVPNAASLNAAVSSVICNPPSLNTITPTTNLNSHGNNRNISPAFPSSPMNANSNIHSHNFGYHNSQSFNSHSHSQPPLPYNQNNIGSTNAYVPYKKEKKNLSIKYKPTEISPQPKKDPSPISSGNTKREANPPVFELYPNYKVCK